MKNTVTRPDTSPLLEELSSLHAQALQPQHLSKKVKELIALGAAVAAGCETSIAYHLHNVLEAGATRAEIAEALEVAVLTLSEPAAIHGAQILKALAPDDAPLTVVSGKAAQHPYMSAD